MKPKGSIAKFPRDPDSRLHQKLDVMIGLLDRMLKTKEKLLQRIHKGKNRK